MELSEFISATLDQIMGGVTDATLKHQMSGRFGFINPMDGTKADEFDSIPVSEVRFDVAVTVESASSDNEVRWTEREGSGGASWYRNQRQIRGSISSEFLGSRMLADN